MTEQLHWPERGRGRERPWYLVRSRLSLVLAVVEEHTAQIHYWQEEEEQHLVQACDWLQRVGEEARSLLFFAEWKVLRWEHRRE